MCFFSEANSVPTTEAPLDPRNLQTPAPTEEPDVKGKECSALLALWFRRSWLYSCICCVSSYCSFCLCLLFFTAGGRSHLSTLIPAVVICILLILVGVGGAGGYLLKLKCHEQNVSQNETKHVVASCCVNQTRLLLNCLFLPPASKVWRRPKQTTSSVGALLKSTVVVDVNGDEGVALFPLFPLLDLPLISLGIQTGSMSSHKWPAGPAGLRSSWWSQQISIGKRKLSLIGWRNLIPLEKGEFTSTNDGNWWVFFLNLFGLDFEKFSLQKKNCTRTVNHPVGSEHTISGRIALHQHDRTDSPATAEDVFS